MVDKWKRKSHPDPTESAPTIAPGGALKIRTPSMRSHAQTQFFELPPALLARATQVRAQFEMESGAAYQVSWSLPGRKER
ncbi:MAG: hypothetical protein AAF582_06475 [Pseudomonadota bacterium]